MVGFRWSYSQDTNLDGFIVSYNENSFMNTKNVTIIPPQKCSAWPEYFCHTFYNLSPSNNYTFKVRIVTHNDIQYSFKILNNFESDISALFVFST